MLASARMRAPTGCSSSPPTSKNVATSRRPAVTFLIDWVCPGRDRAGVRASRERLIAAAVAERAIVVFTHVRTLA
jgi:hypothetical protein